MPQVVVIDCGSTNLRAIAVNEMGQIVASASRPNESMPQPDSPRGYIVWDLERIWQTIGEVCQEVAGQGSQVQAVTLTTWGADGAPIRADDTFAYPPICWQDARTAEMVTNFDRYMELTEAYNITGYVPISFNTILRFIWLRERHPEVFEGTQWLMMPGLLSWKLCGERSIDPTAAGTMMALEMGQRDWSERMLSLAGLDKSFFPNWVEPGGIIGHLTAAAAEHTGLPPGIPVVACGHDTQFAAIGSGAQPGEAILSSGTWEILMLRENRFAPNAQGMQDGVIYEADAVAGYFNPQLLMMGSGVLEWIRDHHFAGLTGGEEVYATLLGEAEAAGVGAGGVSVLPSFVSDCGPARRFNTHGTMLGLGITTDRGQVYRAALEGLGFQLRHALQVIGSACQASPSLIRVVGGGSKNALWNQIRADVTGLPIATISQKEATVVGAAMFAFLGSGEFAGLGEAQQAMTGAVSVVEPGPDHAQYSALYERYLQALQDLAGYYSA